MRDRLITNSQVRRAQEALQSLGFYDGKIDGLRGPKTNGAIVAFKKSIGFRQRPYVGKLTLAALVPSDFLQSGTQWMEEAAHVLHLHEARNRNTLVRWFDRSLSWVDPREVPWCGAFVATVLRKWQPDIILPTNPLGARNWSAFGDPCTPQFGAVLTFWRGSKDGWKGHVGFYVGENDTAFKVRGGNQRNAVTDTWISKHRLLQSRWPLGHPQPGNRMLLAQNGRPLSTNEA